MAGKRVEGAPERQFRWAAQALDEMCVKVAKSIQVVLGDHEQHILHAADGLPRFARERQGNSCQIGNQTLHGPMGAGVEQVEYLVALVGGRGGFTQCGQVRVQGREFVLRMAGGGCGQPFQDRLQVDQGQLVVPKGLIFCDFCGF